MANQPEYDPLRGQQRVFTTQLVLCLWMGISSFLLFCFLRYRWPHIYAIRTLRNSNVILKAIPTSYFGWISLVLSVTEDEVLEYSGLDAYVFIMFFKMGIRIFFQLSVLAVFILSPVRFYYTGHFDKDDIPWRWPEAGVLFVRFVASGEFSGDDGSLPDFGDIDDFPHYLWVYPLFAYLFSGIVYMNLFDYTNRIIKTRQKYLASQDSITDRTIRIDGIPRRLLMQKNTEILKDFIEDLGIGKVLDINMIYDCQPLDQLLDVRKKLVRRIERYISSKHQLNIDIYNENCPTVSVRGQLVEDPKLMAYMEKLDNMDQEISEIQHTYKQRFDDNLILHKDPVFRQIPSAFVTMDSVASAQMAAQTVLDPRVYKLMVNLAPAPTDIKWSNLKLNYYTKIAKGYIITLIIILSYFPILFLVSSLATLLELKSISKFWPELGEFIKKSNWLTTFVTGILPPLLYSLLNLTMPYFYRYLSRCQGYTSNSDIELSSLSKNFFFIFFNLFLVFMITGTIWDYLSFIRDTTKIAFQLASSLKKKSLFYVDLILLQGLGMFPIRLLQIGDVVLLNLIGKIFFLNRFFLRTPRDYRFYYFTPPIFDFGIQVPQHILIFMIILIYSVVSTKIVASGLVYFGLGYLVYKYQLIYNYVHPPHSTGKVWPMIFRRLILGTILFQLFMCGTLALEGAVLLSILCFPLIVVTLVVIYNYEKYYLPLNNFIALRAIQSPLEFDKEFDDEVEEETASQDIETIPTLHVDMSDTDSMLVNGDYTVDYMSMSTPTRKRRISTLDEEREKYSNYMYPNLICDLDGPMVEFEGDRVALVRVAADEEMDSHRLILVTKNLVVSEWE
ncbi:hypothetical protein PSN45_002710 [Yamadazyma tenuis]|uniref:DUF221-domain-containing protein n=1 Tax=Candida tenuis (strain ATCC 10573 / BCRC 21748 / CBS 615 / JCM 9827 / NBRC 10315 / NRRL Y-1498 / VKM Y-70) TaxID=590646 RepID=G3AX27_CANTC|nr:DUF221-domain-containing protein [Yamadazyma tenuis ATCC 10573]EGV66674.1 DUF221-domain-containing protein [Yamadazyma tenuis ATCC 10573]WEJ95197.1 hypothetical protein PSN45_002710 [Yamadazyma tenuis]